MPPFTVSKFFSIQEKWINRAALCITMRQGVMLKDVLVEAESGKALSIPTDAKAYQTFLHSHPNPKDPPQGSGADILHHLPEQLLSVLVLGLESILRNRVGYEVNRLRQQHKLAPHPQPEKRVPPSGSSSSHGTTMPYIDMPHDPAHEEIEKERMFLVQTVVRAAVAGAIVGYQRAQNAYFWGSADCSAMITTMSNLSNAEQQEAQKKRARNDGQTDNGAKNENKATAAAAAHACFHNIYHTLLRGLLFSFEAFQVVHAMPRGHYPPRVGSQTSGTVGWDTIVLFYFVHHIPQVARRAKAESDAIHRHQVLRGVAGEGEGDEGPLESGANTTFVGDAVRHWRRLLVSVQSADAAEAPEHSRRRGALSIVNGLLFILFLHYNTHQCSILLQSIEHAETVAASTGDQSRSILFASKHIISEMVTYYYYKGRMKLYEHRYVEAYTALRESFTMLPSLDYHIQRSASTNNARPLNTAQIANKKRVIFYLCVAGLLAGLQTPPDVAAQDGGAPQLPAIFADLRAAMAAGALRRFTALLEAHSTIFRRRGVYLLLLQQGTLLCLWFLLRRVHAGLEELGRDSSRVTIANLMAAYVCIVDADEVTGQTTLNKRSASSPPKKIKLNARGTAGGGDSGDCPPPPHKMDEEDGVIDVNYRMSSDRLCLWVSKLIALGYVRGYLSYEFKTLVLSKKDPFPLMINTATAAATK